MPSSKFARIHNRILKQRKYLQRRYKSRKNFPFNLFNDWIDELYEEYLLNQFIIFVNSNKLFENCCCDRGTELAKQLLKHNENIKQVAYTVDTIISDELYELYLQNQDE